jgi:hypothetical protein
MSTAVDQELTLADVLRQLGGISPRRIRFHPAPGTATEQDVIEANTHQRRCPAGHSAPAAKVVRSKSLTLTLLPYSQGFPVLSFLPCSQGFPGGTGVER